MKLMHPTIVRILKTLSFEGALRRPPVVDVNLERRDLCATVNRLFQAREVSELEK
jgi:hypothetical protein